MSVAGIIGGCLVSLIGAGKLLLNGEFGFAIATILGVGIAAFANIGKIVKEVWDDKRNEYADRIDDVLTVIFRMLLIVHHLSNGSKDPKLRICLFAPVSDDEVMQVTDYIGTGNRYGRWNKMPCTKGVVGVAFRSGERQYARIPKDTDRISWLIARFSFTKAEALDLRDDAMSYAAIPIGRKNNVVGVIFLDSCDREFFHPANCRVRVLLKYAAVGIAELIHTN